MGVMLAFVAAAAVAVQAPSIESKPVEVPAETNVAGVPSATLTVPALMPVVLEIVVPLTSKDCRNGEMFPIRLARSVDLGGGNIVPAGTPGMGQVIQAAKAGFGGRPGELVLAARYLDFGGVHIALRSFSFADTRGHDHSGTAEAVAIAAGAVGSIAALFITGGEVRVPAGTVAYAKTASATLIPAPQTPPPLQIERIP